MVVCDYNKDGNVTGADATAVYSVASKAADLRYDLNGDGSVTGADATTVYAIASSLSYFLLLLLSNISFYTS